MLSQGTKIKLIELATQVTIAAIENKLVHSEIGSTLTNRSKVNALDPIAFFEVTYQKMAQLVDAEE